MCDIIALFGYCFDYALQDYVLFLAKVWPSLGQNLAKLWGAAAPQTPRLGGGVLGGGRPPEFGQVLAKYWPNLGQKNA